LSGTGPVRIGVALRSPHRFIDEDELAAYKFGRVIRLEHEDVDGFIERRRIAPGALEHLYPGRREAAGEPDVAPMSE